MTARTQHIVDRTYRVTATFGVVIFITCMTLHVSSAHDGSVKHKAAGNVRPQGGIILQETGNMRAQGGFILQETGGVRSEGDILLENPDSLQKEEVIIDSEIKLHGVEVIEATEPPLPKMHQSVPVDVFEKKLRDATTLYDVIRIFYRPKLSDADIDRVMNENIMSARVPFGSSSQPEERSWSDMKADMNQVINHIQSNKVHECVPVPVYIPIATKHRRANLHYYPDCTKVYRCRTDASCCPRDKECRAKSEEKVKRPFIASELTTDGTSVFSSQTPVVHWFDFTNHTECSCQLVNTLPECKRCPLPFKLTRPEIHDCHCDCPKEDSLCKKMKRGKRELDKEYISCIKNNQCEPPTCQYASFTEFWLNKGICPSKHHRQPSAVTPGYTQVSFSRSFRRAASTRRGRRKRKGHRPKLNKHIGHR